MMVNEGHCNEEQRQHVVEQFLWHVCQYAAAEVVADVVAVLAVAAFVVAA